MKQNVIGCCVTMKETWTATLMSSVVSADTMKMHTVLEGEKGKRPRSVSMSS